MDNRINSRIYYNHGKVHNSIVINTFKLITFFLKSLIDSGSPYAIFFSLVVHFFFFYTYFIFNTMLNVYHQGYVMYVITFLNIFHFFCVYIIFMEGKKIHPHLPPSPLPKKEEELIFFVENNISLY